MIIWGVFISMLDRLNARQTKFAKLVANGMPEKQAALEAGYSNGCIKHTLLNLRGNARVQDQITYFKDSSASLEVADKLAREKFWTTIMNDPTQQTTARLKASEHLGKAQGDFINNSKVEHSGSGKPIIMIPESSPKQWEEFWENNND